MALPSVVAPFALVSGFCPPFLSSNDDVYIVARTNLNRIGVYKSSDVENWTEYASSVGASASANTTCVQDGDIIHIARSGTSSGTTTYSYHTFDMSTDAFVIDDEEITTSEANSSNSAQCYLAPRSDGTIVALFIGDSDAIMGGDKVRLDLIIKDGTWGSVISVDDGGDVHYGGIRIVKASDSDTCHILYTSTDDTADPPTSMLYNHAKTLSPSDVLSSDDLYSATGFAQQLKSLSGPVAFDDSGTQKVHCNTTGVDANNSSESLNLEEDGSGNATHVSRVENVSGTPGVDDRLNTPKLSLAVDRSDNSLHVLWVENTDDIRYSISDDLGATWSTSTSEYTEESDFINSNIYTRDGSTVLAYFFNDNLQVPYYNEIALSVAAQDLTPAGLTSAEEFGTHTLGLFILPSSILTSEAFGTASVVYVITPTGIVSEESFGAATLGLFTLPSSILSEEAFGSHLIGVDVELEVFPVGIPSAEVVNQPNVDMVMFTVGIPSEEIVNSPTVEHNIILTGIPSMESFGTAGVVGGPVTLYPVGIRLEVTSNKHHVQHSDLATMVGIESAEAFGVVHPYHPPVVLGLAPQVRKGAGPLSLIRDSLTAQLQVAVGIGSSFQAPVLVDELNAPVGTVGFISAVADDDRWHVVTFSTENDLYQYHRFDLNSWTWVITNETVVDTSANPPEYPFSDLDVLSDRRVVLAFAGRKQYNDTDLEYYEAVYCGYRNESGWLSIQEMFTIPTWHCMTPTVAVTKSLTNESVLVNASAVSSTTTPEGQFPPTGWNIGAVQRILVADWSLVFPFFSSVYTGISPTIYNTSNTIVLPLGNGSDEYVTTRCMYYPGAGPWGTPLPDLYKVGPVSQIINAGHYGLATTFTITETDIDFELESFLGHHFTADFEGEPTFFIDVKDLTRFQTNRAVLTTVYDPSTEDVRSYVQMENDTVGYLQGYIFADSSEEPFFYEAVDEPQSWQYQGTDGITKIWPLDGIVQFTTGGAEGYTIVNDHRFQGIQTLQALGVPYEADNHLLFTAISPAGINSSEAFGGLIQTLDNEIRPLGTESAEGFGSFTFDRPINTLLMAGIASSENIPYPNLVRFVAPPSIPTDEMMGIPILALDGDNLLPAGIVSGEAYGSFSTSYGAAPLVATGIPSDEEISSAFVIKNEGVSLPSIVATKPMLAGEAPPYTTGAYTFFINVNESGVLRVYRTDDITKTSWPEYGDPSSGGGLEPTAIPTTLAVYYTSSRIRIAVVGDDGIIEYNKLILSTSKWDNFRTNMEINTITVDPVFQTIAIVQPSYDYASDSWQIIYNGDPIDSGGIDYETIYHSHMTRNNEGSTGFFWQDAVFSEAGVHSFDLAVAKNFVNQSSGDNRTFAMVEYSSTLVETPVIADTLSQGGIQTFDTEPFYTADDTNTQAIISRSRALSVPLVDGEWPRFIVPRVANDGTIVVSITEALSTATSNKFTEADYTAPPAITEIVGAGYAVAVNNSRACIDSIYDATKKMIHIVWVNADDDNHIWHTVSYDRAITWREPKLIFAVRADAVQLGNNLVTHDGMQFFLGLFYEVKGNTNYAELEVFQDVRPGGLNALHIVNPPFVSSGVPLYAESIESEEAFGRHYALLEDHVATDSIPSEEAFGDAGIETSQAVQPVGIISAEAFGSPDFINFLHPTGIQSGEGIGLHSISTQSNEVVTRVPTLLFGQLAVLALEPSVPAKETLTWKTEIASTLDGTEERHKLRTHPRQAITYRIPEAPAHLNMAELTQVLGLAENWLTPLWFERQAIAQVDATDSTINVPTTNYDFRDQSLALLYENETSWEVVEIATVTPTQLNLLSPVKRTYLAPSIMPARVGIITRDIAKNHTGSSAISSITFSVTDNASLEVSAPAQFQGDDLYLDDGLLVDTTHPFIQSISTRNDIIDFDLGLFDKTTPWLYNRVTVKTRQVFQGAADIRLFKQFLERRSGRFTQFWQPTYTPDLTNASTGLITTVLSVELIGENVFNIEGVHLAILDTSGNWYVRTIDSVLLVGDILNLTLDSALNIQADTIDTISFLLLNRLQPDMIEMEWIGNDVLVNNLNTLALAYN